MTLILPQPWPTNPWPSQFRTVRASNTAASSDHGLPPGLTFVTVNSPALGGRGDLAVYTPASATGRSVPLVILLHGVFGSFWNWAFLGSAHRVLEGAIAAGDVDPMVLAMPSDGLRAEGTAYLTHPTFDAERWIIDDVPACVAEVTAASAAATGSSIGPVDVDVERFFLCGNSMGGFGALRLAARHRDRVRAAVGLSSITHLDELATFTADDIGDAAGLTPEERGLATAITSSAAMPPFAFDCGTADPLIDGNRQLHQQLTDRGIPHRYDEHAGDHSWAWWPERFAAALQFFQSQQEGK